MHKPTIIIDRRAVEFAKVEREVEQLRAQLRAAVDALRPFYRLAKIFEDKTSGVDQVEDADRIRLEYSWGEFRSSLKVGELRAVLPVVAAYDAQQEGTRLVRDESTEDRREIWRAVDKAASRLGPEEKPCK